jgi:hypothetical protein
MCVGGSTRATQARRHSSGTASSTRRCTRLRSPTGANSNVDYTLPISTRCGSAGGCTRITPRPTISTCGSTDRHRQGSDWLQLVKLARDRGYRRTMHIGLAKVSLAALLLAAIAGLRRRRSQRRGRLSQIHGDESSSGVSGVGGSGGAAAGTTAPRGSSAGSLARDDRRSLWQRRWAPGRSLSSTMGGYRTRSRCFHLDTLADGSLTPSAHCRSGTRARTQSFPSRRGSGASPCLP